MSPNNGFHWLEGQQRPQERERKNNNLGFRKEPTRNIANLAARSPFQVRDQMIPVVGISLVFTVPPSDQIRISLHTCALAPPSVNEAQGLNRDPAVDALVSAVGVSHDVVLHVANLAKQLTVLALQP